MLITSLNKQIFQVTLVHLLWSLVLVFPRFQYKTKKLKTRKLQDSQNFLLKFEMYIIFN
jgi:hypothetical protein